MFMDISVSVKRCADTFPVLLIEYINIYVNLINSISKIIVKYDDSIQMIRLNFLIIHKIIIYSVQLFC